MLESDQLYEPGDHLAIYPDNDATMVNTILKRLNPDPGPDEPIVVEYRHETGKRIFNTILYIIMVSGLTYLVLLVGSACKLIIDKPVKDLRCQSGI